MNEAIASTHTAAAPPAGEEPLSHLRNLVEGYARAKSCADVDGALAFCHERFGIETVAFGIASRDRAETALHLSAFFDAFPDYEVTLAGMAFGEACVSCWGTAGMTMKGAAFGLPATGRHVTLPIFCVFDVEDGVLLRERFFFDLLAFCDGIGVTPAALRSALDAVRAMLAA